MKLRKLGKLQSRKTRSPQIQRRALREGTLVLGEVGIGVVVHVYADGAAYEVEYLDTEGHTLDVRTVAAENP
jgi:hypothetical protein